MPAKASVVRNGATVTSTPTETIVQQAAELRFDKDERGRKIGVIKPSALARYRLLKMLGAESSRNEVLLGNAMLAYLVREIDSERLNPPNTEIELEFRIATLDDDGLATVAKILVEQFGVVDSDGKIDDATIKN